MKLNQFLKNPLAVLKDSIRDKVDTPPVWYTPHKWADEDGLYASDDDAWLYRSLPLSLLSDAEALNTFLHNLAQTLPGREIHLTLHTWREPPEKSRNLPEALATFQHEAINVLVPVSTLSLAVQLVAKATRPSIRGEIANAADDLLGEHVHDLSLYDDDRAQVTQALAQTGAQPLTPKAMSYLEAWYTHGQPRDISAIEGDDIITLTNSKNYIELAAAGTLNTDIRAGALPPFSKRGCMVISLRGRLRLIQYKDNRKSHAVLMRTSVIYGRLSSELNLSLPDALRSIGSVKPRPLPLRQLSALHETLPASRHKLTPTLQRVGVNQLRALGFTDQERPGAPAGLLVGMGGRDLPNAFFLNPFLGAGITGIFGDPKAGKTVFAELLATQAHLGNFDTLYISGSGASGRGYAGLTGVPLAPPPTPGQYDPFKTTQHPHTGNLIIHWLNSLASDAALTAEEQNEIRRGAEQALAVNAQDLETTFHLSNSLTGQAKLLRHLDRVSAYSVLRPAPNPPPLPEGSCVLFTGSFHKYPNVVAMTIATTLINKAASNNNTVVVLDELPAHVLQHPAVHYALSVAAAANNIAILFTSEAPEVAKLYKNQLTNTFVMADHTRNLSKAVLPELTPKENNWITDAEPILAGNRPARGSGGIYKNDNGNLFRFEVGLLPSRGQNILLRSK